MNDEAYSKSGYSEVSDYPDYGEDANQPMGERKPYIIDAMDVHSNLLESLEAAIDHLADTLAPILTQKDKELVHSENEDYPVPLASEIAGQSTVLRRCWDKLQDIHSRVEL